MKFPAYPKYKNSGVQWLGEVPEHWNIRPIKRLVSTPVTDGPHETPEIFTEGIPFVSAEAINYGRINFDKIRGHISEEDHQKFSKKYKPEKGDLFMVKSGATTGRVAMVETDIEFNIWSPLAAIRPDFKLATSRFIYHYLHSNEFQTAVQLGWNFGTQQNIGMGVIQNLAVPTPPLPEQTAIANFLDRETGRIDTLVAKKRRLLALLEEKRTALISRTVTRGLPGDAARDFGLEPHTRFKDSGVDWLGEVPESWEVLPLRYIFQNQDYRRIPLSAVERADMDKVYPYYGASGIIDYVDNYIFDQTMILVAEDGANLFSRSSPLAFLASGKYWVNNHAHILKPRFGDIRYWVNVLQSFDYTPLVTGAAQPKLTAERLGTIILPKPANGEQNAIATYLDRETAKIDQLKEKIQEAIARLQEYRTALITAAVTGKIDVRETGE